MPSTVPGSAPLSVPRGWAPSSQTEQELHLPEHPVYQRQYTVPTPPLKWALDLALERIKGGATCCGFVGPPRSGKTAAAGYIANAIRTDIPRVCVIEMLFRRDTPTRDYQMLDWLSHQTGGTRVSGIKNSDAMNALCLRWAAEASSLNASRIVFVQDEVNRLQYDQLTTLADISNTLEKFFRMRTTTVSFGSKEIVALKNSLLQIERNDLIGRFLTRLHQFHGIRNSKELAEVMDAFDDADVADYPEFSHCAFSQFFRPADYANGWRLKNGAPMLWNEFLKVGPGKKQMDVGAEYAFAAIEYVLKTSRNVKASDLPASIWKKAVAESGYIDSLYDLRAQEDQ